MGGQSSGQGWRKVMSEPGLLALVKVLIRGFKILVGLLEAFQKEQKGA